MMNEDENDEEIQLWIQKEVDDDIFDKKKIAILSLLVLMIILIRMNNKKKILNVCLCTLGKKENRYIREFVDFYKNIGFDKIILYDNNDIDDEKFEYVISDYINSGFVEIKNYRGKNKIQIDSINDCLKHNMRLYDWIMVNDIDEFLHLKEGNIKTFLSLDRLKKCNLIHFNWRYHTDGEQLYYKNESVFKRFPDVFLRYPETVKSIIRGRRIHKLTLNHHVLRYNDNGCNAHGSIIKEEDFINAIQINPDYKDYYFDHFFTKSTEEYIDKKNRGSCLVGSHIKIDLRGIDVYFSINKLTLEKIEFFENRTGLNLSTFRQILKKNMTY